MKILVYQGRKTAGGSKRSLFNLSKALKEENEILYICGTKGWFTEELAKHDFSYEYIEEFQLFDRIFTKLKNDNIRKILSIVSISLFSLKNLVNITVFLKKNKIDLVFLNETRDFYFIGIPAILTNTKRVSFVRGKVNKLDYARFYFSNIIVSLSTNLIKELPENLKRKSVIIPNFMDISKEFQIQHNKTHSKVNIAFVGSIIPVKGLERLIKIARNLNENFVINIYGDTPRNQPENYKKDLMESIKSYGLESNFIFHGWVNSINSELRKNDILVLTSHSEGLPRSIMEGMLNQLPIVSYDVGGVSDLVKNEYNGYLIKNGDIEDFSKKLGELIVHQERREIYGQNSYKLIKENFSKEEILKKYAIELSKI